MLIELLGKQSVGQWFMDALEVQGAVTAPVNVLQFAWSLYKVEQLHKVIWDSPGLDQLLVYRTRT